ncbi:hypothetical protein [Tersicoccus sp. Bi-70]|uniref:hypothetical protein n=1 Tax=Tersicoccus sp. Bi-70 TaxID=1897634 RepID=UPI001E542315|nr:hypothetical protein [Tersicoccus sp. Bi-70]
MNVLVPTAMTATGLFGGYAAARLSGVRAVGGVVLAAAGAAAFAGWKQNVGTGRAAALTGVYLAAFGGSHPLAKRLGAWPSVATVAGATAIASLAAGRR